MRDPQSSISVSDLGPLLPNEFSLMNKTKNIFLDSLFLSTLNAL